MPRGKVKRIIDGDTFELRSGERVRVAGLNSPELGQRGGQEARRRLRAKIPPGTEVGLSRPLAKSYGRTVRRVSVDGKNVARVMRPATRGRKRK